MAKLLVYENWDWSDIIARVLYGPSLPQDLATGAIAIVCSAKRLNLPLPQKVLVFDEVPPKEPLPYIQLLWEGTAENKLLPLGDKFIVTLSEPAYGAFYVPADWRPEVYHWMQEPQTIMDEMVIRLSHPDYSSLRKITLRLPGAK